MDVPLSIGGMHTYTFTYDFCQLTKASMRPKSLIYNIQYNSVSSKCFHQILFLTSLLTLFHVFLLWRFLQWLFYSMWLLVFLFLLYPEDSNSKSFFSTVLSSFLMCPVQMHFFLLIYIWFVIFHKSKIELYLVILFTYYRNRFVTQYITYLNIWGALSKNFSYIKVSDVLCYKQIPII